MKIQRIATSRIKPAAYNPRIALKPGDPDYERLVRSISEFGLVEPLIWNKRTGNLVGGHQRLTVLLAQGATDVDVSVVDLSLEREKALNIALNKISGDWDQEKLAKLLDELTRIPDFDVGLTGFDAPEADALIAGMLHGDDGPEETFDLAAALANAATPVTRPGDLIVLGKDPKLQHRLLCGDCTDPAQVRRLMDGKRAVLFATDPPYLVNYDGTNHPGTAASRPTKNKDWSKSYGVTWDDASANPELYDKFIAAAVKEAIAPSAAWYCWHASRRQAMLEAVWEKHGAFVHQQIIMVKHRGVLNRSWYLWQHEPCFFGWSRGVKPHKTRDPMLSTVWPVNTSGDGDEERPDHPTPKPLAVFAIPMKQHTRPGEVCYEPFAGSGSQVIAAQSLGRRCHAVEISPTYCDVIVRRFIAYAGVGSVSPQIAEKYRVRPAQGRKAAPAPQRKDAQ